MISVWFYARGYTNAKEEEYCSRSRCTTTDQGVQGTRKSPRKTTNKQDEDKRSGMPSALSRLLLGTEWNPRILGVDIKMWLYIVGATYLQLNICSAMEVQKHENGGSISLALKTYSALFTFFLFEYLAGEQVHLYTYDLFAEKVGAKLLWGCFFFYPFFYCIGIHRLVSAAQDITHVQCVLITTLYFIGWICTRGANMQKYFYKRNPKNKTCFFGFIEQKSLPKNNKILISGFWGVSRHFNYAGEIMQAIALAAAESSLFSMLLNMSCPNIFIDSSELSSIFEIS